MKTILYILSLVMVVLTSCTREDDINEIFLSKCWYINGIRHDGKEAEKEDMQAIFQNGQDCYRIVFNDGTFIATLSPTKVVTGRWSADGKKQALHFYNVDAPSNLSTLDNEFVEIIQKATSYEGDSNVLLIKKDRNNFIRMCEKR
ncbi:MAG: DUF4847 family protein [Bacteroidaceae bacterium]|nr:DUF4847 family protein [Bacteroidaceae bacterium]